jgi:hypothetical protein
MTRRTDGGGGGAGSGTASAGAAGAAGDGSGSPPRLPASARALVRRLVELRADFSEPARVMRFALLERLADTEILDPRTLLDYHEALLFTRAYPDDARTFRLACREARGFAARVQRLRAFDPDAAAELEDSGLVETPMYYRYDFSVVDWLVRWYGDTLDIDWGEFEETEKIDHLLPLCCAWVENDALDLADIGTREWLEMRRGGHGRSSLRWLLDRLAHAIPDHAARMRVYDALDLPVVWQLGDLPAARTHAGSASARPYYHADGLLRRIDDFGAEITRPLEAIRRAPASRAASLIKLVRSTLAVRHRALYPIDFATRDEVLVADVGRGYELVLFGMQPAWRLPVESDYGVLVLKNGFVFGYGVGAMLFDDIELAVNIFETWRGGESRYVFAQFVRVFHAHFGSTRFKIERYQVGYENEEGIQSGSFWFYYNLGFVPRLEEVRELAAAERAKIRRDRGYRSSVRVLERLAESDLYLTLDPDRDPFAPDFPIADLSLAVTRLIGERHDGDAVQATAAATESVARALRCPGWRRWPEPQRIAFERLSLVMTLVPGLERWPSRDKQALVALLRAKGKAGEAEYARRMVEHRRLRRALEEVVRGA